MTRGCSKREGRGIVLTGEGSRLLIHSRRILKEYEALNEDMASAGNVPVSGELNLGASSTMAQYVLLPSWPCSAAFTRTSAYG